MTESVVDADTGRVALTRAQLTGLARHAAGHDLDAEVREALVAVGALGDDGVHSLLQPLLATLTGVSCRGALRRWHGGPRRPVEILVGRAGVVMLHGGADPDAVQEVRWHPRPSAVARLVAELLDLPVEDGPPALDSAPRPWSELVDLASHPGAGIGLADLRWAGGVDLPLISVLVIAWHRDGGIVEVEPVDDAPAGPATAAVRSADGLSDDHPTDAGDVGPPPVVPHPPPGLSRDGPTDAGDVAGDAHPTNAGADSGGGGTEAVSRDAGDDHPVGLSTPDLDRSSESRAANSRLVRCTARHPIEVWTALTELASRATAAWAGRATGG